MDNDKVHRDIKFNAESATVKTARANDHQVFDTYQISVNNLELPQHVNHLRLTFLFCLFLLDVHISQTHSIHNNNNIYVAGFRVWYMACFRNYLPQLII